MTNLPNSSNGKLKDTTMPELSAEIFIIPFAEERFIIYAPIRQAAFVGNSQVVKLLADLQRGVPDQALAANSSVLQFFRELKIIDEGIEPLPITSFQGDPEPTMVTLFLTTACNLRCTYCYASAGDTPIKSMKLAVAKRGIDFVADNALKKRLPFFEVAYHGGGEPTVSWRVMTDSLEYARDKAAELRIGLRATTATNGVLSKEKIEWIIQHLEGASLSFDGLPSVQDTHRLTVLGQGSSTQVIHTMRCFDEAKFPYGIRMTITADQIPLLPESVEYVCATFRPQRIQVEPAYELGRYKGSPSAETEAFINAFRTAQQRARPYGQEIFFSGARLGILTNHFCGVTQDGFALTPDGNVSGCYEVFSEDNPLAKTFIYGEPDKKNKGYKFELPVLNNLRQQAVQQRPFCQGCFAKWTCAGDCYHKSLTVNGQGEFVGSDRCHIIRELTKDQILDKIADSGESVWASPVE
ncbi:MAG: SPASM domain-containing protein [Bryobacterales bacterium]